MIGHRLRIAPDTVLLDGLPVTGPAETWCQLAGVPEIEDLVAAADYLLGDGRAPGICTRDELAAAIAVPGRYRTAALRRALGLARTGSRSPQESRLRVVLVLAGLPEPELNGEVVARDGRVLGHGDLVWRRYRAVSEYEGDQHRTDPEQYAYDIRRYDEFQAEGWRLLRVVKDELQKPNRPALVLRARRLLAP